MEEERVLAGVSWENSVGKKVNLGRCMGLCGRRGHFFEVEVACVSFRRR